MKYLTINARRNTFEVLSYPIKTNSADHCVFFLLWVLEGKEKFYRESSNKTFEVFWHRKEKRSIKHIQAKNISLEISKRAK